MSQEGQPRMGDVRQGLGTSLGRATEFKRAKLAPTFALLAVVGLLLAFAPSALAAEGGQITGKVISSSSTAAIAGIEVCAAESVFEAELFGHCAKTNASGEYSISELPAGSYGVGFFAPEGSGLNYIPQFYNGKSSIGEAELFVVEAGKTVSGINAAMQVGGQITGKVTDASSKAAITGIQVCASLIEGEAFGCAKTASNGQYTVSGLPSGAYRVFFSSPEGTALNYLSQYYNGKVAYAEASLVSATAGSTTPGIDAAMVAGGQITGKVTSAVTKAGIEGIQVCANPAGGSGGRCATTNSGGEYSVAGLVAGEYRIEFNPLAQNYLRQYYNGKSSFTEATAVAVTTGSTTPGIDAAMVAGGQITGKVTDAATKTPLANISVCPQATSGGLGISCVASNASGEYTVAGLATGEYKLEFSANGGENYVTQYYNGKSSFTEASPVSAAAGSTTSGIDAAMIVGGKITGKVTAAATKASLAGVQVCASPVSGGLNGCAATNAAGEYTIVGLATGEYRVEFRPGYSCGSGGCTSQNYLTQYYSGKVSFSEAEPVSVTAGSATLGVDAAMVEGGTITGKITNSATKASLGGIQVCPLTIGGSYGGQCTTANSGGEYTIVGLATSEYKVQFSSSTGAYFTQYYNGKGLSAEATAIAVTAATTTSGIDAAMVEGGRITGKVTSAATKAGVEGVQVCAEREGLFGQCAQTNTAGEYTISGLATGEYSVRFQSNSGNYLSQYYNGKSAASEANPVSVADSTTTSGINAALAAGGQVIGKVTSAATKAGVEDIEVCVSPSEGGACAVTGATGEYTINALPTGKYTVRFSVPYESGLNYLPQYYNGKASFVEATPVSVTAGSATANVDAALAAGGQITGTVTDASSKSPAKGIQVCASPTSAGESGECTTSNANGEYDLNSLATGEYKVQFSVPYGSNPQYVEQYYNGKSSFSAADAVVVTAGATKTGIDAAMVLKGQITGKVTDATGSTPVSGIQVSVYQASGFYPIAYATTNAYGEYAVQGLATGEYKVQFSVPYGSRLNYLPQYYNNKQSLSEASAVSVSVGAVTGEVNAKVQAGGQITGKVTNASTKAALGGIQVCPQTATGGFAGQCVTSNASGDYTIIALPTAEYKVQFSSISGANFVTQYYNAKSSVTEANPVSVTAGSTTSGIDTAMVVGAKITGKVTNVSTNAAVGGIQVSVYPMSSSFPTTYATTNASGEYTVVGLATGEYRVEFSLPYGSSLNYLAQYYNGKESFGEANPVSVTAGATTPGINAAMVVGGKITGKVTDAATKTGISSAYVCLEAPKSTFFGTCAYTNGAGEYTFAGLPSGEYKVEFQAFSGGYSTQYYNDKGSAPEAEPVSVTTGTTTAGINAALVVGGEVTGVVTSSATKTGVGGVQVCATSVGKEPFIRCASTSTGGEYTIVGLATGEYKVEFNPISQNYLHQYYNGKESSSEASPVSVTTGATTSGINAALAVGGEITGKVTNATSKAAVGGIQVCPLTSTGSFIGLCTTSNSSGEYILAGLATGEYKIEFYPTNGTNYVPQYYNGKSSSSEATLVPVTAGSTTSGINAAMVVGAQITGKVTNASSKAAASGIDVCPRATSTFFIQCATTSSSGEYTLVGLGTGEYKIEFNAAGQNYLPQYYNGKSLESEGNPVSVTAGTTTTGVNAALIVGGEITGKVTEASTQAAIAGIEVCSSPTTGFGFFARCTMTSSNGEYAIVALTTGEYDVRFSSPSNSYAVQYYNKKTSLTFANAVSVTTGSTTSAINAELANLPASVKAPVITGTAQQGHTLTEAHGSWTNNPTSYNYQWELCSSTGNECAAISGATEQTYVPVLADEGHTLKVTETAVNLAGSGSPATSTATSVVLPLPPVSTKSSSISGTAQQGKTLTEAHGTWENNPTSYTYQWLRCNEEGKSCMSISGATEETYVPVSLDVGHTLVVNEVAHNAGGPSNPAPSPATTVVVPPVPVDTKVPTITGTAVQGQTLTEAHGSWENSPTEYIYQWERCNTSGTECAAISEATEQTYALIGADVGHTIRVQETAINAGGSSTPAVSGPTAKVAAAAPVSISPPSISGTAQQGQALTEEHGTWTNEPTEYKYQWLRCDSEGKSCAAIAGATGQSYTSAVADVGHMLEVQETAHNAGGDSKPATSSPTSVVVPPVPINAEAPTITGTAVQGQTLTEAHGTWENSPESYEYQWLRCDGEGKSCTPISGATEQTYTLVTADVGHELEVQEAATNAGGSSAPAVSAPTAKVVAAAPVNISPPSISGTAQQGQAITEAQGSWANEPVEHKSQWLRCDNEGKSCTPIAGATAQTYALTSSDVGHTLQVQEIASNAGGSSTPATSTLTSVVQALEATIESGPTGPTKESGPFTFSANGPAILECAVDLEVFMPCTSPLMLTGLSQGSHVLQVRAVTLSGKEDTTPAKREFIFDTTPPETTITHAPTEPIHNGSLGFAYESSEAGTFECAIDSEPFTPCPEQIVANELAAGEHVFRVRAIDLAGNVDPTPAEAHFKIVNNPAVASLEVNPDTGPSALETTTKIQASDLDGDGLHYELQFGDGASASGVLPVQPLSHTYSQPGVYEMRLAVSDGHEDTIVTHTIAVTLPEPLHASAGDNQTVVVGQPAILDGANSRPLRGITGYDWSFGDGASAEGATVEHTYTTPGEYQAKLTVTGPGQSTSASATIHVIHKPGGEGLVETIQSGGIPVSGAEVLVLLGDGTRIHAVTDSGGVAHLYGLPDGSYRVYAYSPGYLPTTGSATVSGGEGTGSIELKAGEVATAKVTSHPMTLKEIEAAGINTSDPANQHVFEFSVNLDVEPVGGGGVGGGSGGIGGYIGGGGFIPVGTGSPCSGLTCVWHAGGATIYTTVIYIPGVEAPILSSLVIPFKASFLKEFYDVSMIVNNLASPAFTLKSGHAEISLPGGLSLAPTAKPQTLTQSLPDIPGGGSATANWVLRGDTEGEYNLAATYAGSLEPFGRTITLNAATTEPIHVWGASALRLTVDVDKQVQDKYPFHVRVGLTNVANVPVYNPTIELLKAGRHGYIEQPSQQNTFSEREVKPGETYWTGPFILVPEATGNVNLEKSFIKKIGGDVEISSTITTHERVPSIAETPQIKGHRRNSHTIALEWEPVPGASGYEVYKTPNRETDFPGTADPNVIPRGETKAVITDAPEEPKINFAISSIINGQHVMVHPMISSTEVTPGGYPHTQVTDHTRCGSSQAEASVVMEDPDFPLKEWVRSTGGGQGVAEALSGNMAQRPIAGDRQPGQLLPYKLMLTTTEPGSAKANPSDASGPSTTSEGNLGECHAVGLGDSFSAGEGVPPFVAGTANDVYGNAGESHCHRSEEAYLPDLVHHHSGIDLEAFVACSGAVAEDITEKNHDQTANPNVGRQTDAITSQTSLVTLSIGGNNVGFAEVLAGCITDNLIGLVVLHPVPCIFEYGSEVEQKLGELPQKLNVAYKGIRSRLTEVGAHNARIIVMGYPYIFPPVSVKVPDTCNLLNPVDIVWIHQMITQANNEIEMAAHGMGLEFVNPNNQGRFDGHSVCDSDGYFNGARGKHGPINLGGQTVESFHPNAKGQQAMEEALFEQIGGPAGTSYTINLGQTILQSIAVTAAATQLNVSITWPGSDVALSLISPNGTVIDRGHVPSGVTHEVGRTFETYTVPDAEPGKWTAKTEGLQVSPEGETVDLQSTQTQVETLPPIAFYAVSAGSGKAPISVKFDGAKSLDPQGSKLSYTWKYGDGTTGSGETSEHIYDIAGTYEPSLTVRDEAGLTSTYSGSAITVTAPTEEGASKETPGGETNHEGGGHSGGLSGSSPGAGSGPGGSSSTNTGPTGTAKNDVLGSKSRKAPATNCKLVRVKVKHSKKTKTMRVCGKPKPKKHPKSKKKHRH